MNERLGPMRVFGESVSEMVPVAFRFESMEVTGRRTSFGEEADTVIAAAEAGTDEAGADEAGVEGEDGVGVDEPED
jgi:hypothetical protein